MKYQISCVLTVMALATVNCKTASKQNSSEAKIIGGEITQRLPQVGLIKRMGGAYCTGTLISRDTVVTAAHCLIDAEPGDLSFVIQQEEKTSGMQISVRSLKMHPKYDAKTSIYDIAILKLASTPTIEPLGVAKNVEPLKLIGQKLLAVGYGRAKKPSEAAIDNSGIGIKREVELTVTAVNDSKIRVEERGKSACNGDSGGAYLQFGANGQPLLVGVTSCGDADCASYGVATRVDTFLDFIGNTPGQAEPTLKAACDSVYNEGVCDQDSVKICHNDCYEVSLTANKCDPGKICRKNPVNGIANCYDPKRLQKVILTFKRLQIVNGRYDAGGPLNDVYLFFDRPETKTAPMIGKHSTIVSPGGTAAIELESGVHTVEGQIYQGSAGVAYIPPQRFEVESGKKEHVFVVPTDLVQIEVTDDVGFDHAIYITGQGDLLGNWQRGEKLRYNGKNKSWIYDGTLARDLEFKLFKATWVDGRHIDMKDRAVSWESLPGNHKVGEGGLPYHGGFHHKITAGFR